MLSLLGATPPLYYKIGDKPSLAIMNKFKRNVQLSVQKPEDEYSVKNIKMGYPFLGQFHPAF